MGYQVGSVCYADRAAAEDAYFSAVVPSIGSDGRLSQPVRKPSGWFLNAQPLQAELPECSPIANFQDGLTIGWMLVLVAVILFITRITSRILQ